MVIAAKAMLVGKETGGDTGRPDSARLSAAGRAHDKLRQLRGTPGFEITGNHGIIVARTC